MFGRFIHMLMLLNSTYTIRELRPLGMSTGWHSYSFDACASSTQTYLWSKIIKGVLFISARSLVLIMNAPFTVILFHTPLSVSRKHISFEILKHSLLEEMILRDSMWSDVCRRRLESYATFILLPVVKRCYPLEKGFINSLTIEHAIH